MGEKEWNDYSFSQESRDNGKMKSCQPSSYRKEAGKEFWKIIISFTLPPKIYIICFLFLFVFPCRPVTARDWICLPGFLDLNWKFVVYSHNEKTEGRYLQASVLLLKVSETGFHWFSCLFIIGCSSTSSHSHTLQEEWRWRRVKGQEPAKSSHIKRVLGEDLNTCRPGQVVISWPLLFERGTR